MANPGHFTAQVPHPEHRSKSMVGRFVIGFPTFMAPLGQDVSQGLHGISSMHSMTAIEPRS